MHLLISAAKHQGKGNAIVLYNISHRYKINTQVKCTFQTEE